MKMLTMLWPMLKRKLKCGLMLEKANEMRKLWCKFFGHTWGDPKGKTGLVKTKRGRATSHWFEVECNRCKEIHKMSPKEFSEW